MKLKKLGLALIVVCALGAVMASSAFAAASTLDVRWFTGTSPGTLLAGTESVTTTGSGEFVTEVGTTKLALKATGIECKSCTISNIGGTAVTTGILLFTGVTVTSPSTCAVEGGKIETRLLENFADFMIGSTDYKLFAPEEGTSFSTIKLVKGTGACALSGSYVLGGKVFARGNNGTGIFAVNQGLTFSGAINSEAGGELTFGSKKAELNGTASVALSGSKKGEAFATHE